MKTATVTTRDRADADPARGFSSSIEFFRAVRSAQRAVDRDGVKDYRLKALTMRGATGEVSFLLPRAFNPASLRAAAGSDEHSQRTDTHGGFLRPSSIAPLLLGAVEGDPTAGRTLALPMDTPDLSVVSRTSVGHATSVSGGLTVVRTGETLPRASSRMALERIELHASDLSGFSWVTEEMIGDSPAAVAAMLDAGYRDEFGQRLLREKIRGRGGDEFHGVLSAPCKIPVDKESGQSADTIVAANVLKMRARCWGYRRAIWLANHNAYGQLATLSVAIGEGGSLALYHHAERDGEPDMLSGRPIFYTEWCSTLGDEGDLILTDWSQYIEATYRPLDAAESMHVRFIEHERAFRFNVRNAGAPWWRAPLTPANGADTLSPIVTLAERA
jgi:hypothetical protein